jgi:hypothetical protein
MKLIGKIVAWIMLMIATGLILIGIQSWPPGGLMFALPFVFLIPSAFLGLVGGTLLWGLNRSSRSLPSETKIFQKPTLGVGSNKTQDNTSQRQE